MPSGDVAKPDTRLVWPSPSTLSDSDVAVENERMRPSVEPARNVPESLDGVMEVMDFCGP